MRSARNQARIVNASKSRKRRTKKSISRLNKFKGKGKDKPILVNGKELNQMETDDLINYINGKGNSSESKNKSNNKGKKNKKSKKNKNQGKSHL